MMGASALIMSGFTSTSDFITFLMRAMGRVCVLKSGSVCSTGIVRRVGNACVLLVVPEGLEHLFLHDLLVGLLRLLAAGVGGFLIHGARFQISKYAYLAFPFFLSW